MANALPMWSSWVLESRLIIMMRYCVLFAFLYPQGIGLGARRITISTCGVLPGIERLMQEGLQVELVSLHAASIEYAMMPVNATWDRITALPL